MKKAELVAEAKKRYPVGTVFLDAFEKNEKQYTVKEFSDYEGGNGWYDDNYIIVYVEGIDGCGKYLYRDGKWADIVSLPNKEIPTKYHEIVEQLKRDYPIGTKFYSVISPKYKYEVNSHSFFEYKTDEITVNKVSGPTIYKDGVFATIISVPESKVINSFPIY